MPIAICISFYCKYLKPNDRLLASVRLISEIPPPLFLFVDTHNKVLFAHISPDSRWTETFSSSRVTANPVTSEHQGLTHANSSSPLSLSCSSYTATYTNSPKLTVNSSLFSKNKTRSRRSPSCLCLENISANFWPPEGRWSCCRGGEPAE